MRGVTGHAIAGLADGIMNGIRLGQAMRDRREAKEEKEAYKNAIAQASKKIDVSQSTNEDPNVYSRKSIYSAGDKSFGSMDEAKAYAENYNSPPQVAARIGAAISQQDPLKGLQFQQAQQGLQLGKANLQSKQNEIKQQEANAANQAFDAELNNLYTPQDMAAFMSASAADGNGGATQFQVIPSEDGSKWSIGQVLDDGSVKSLGFDFQNNEEGIMHARNVLSKGVPLKDKLEHIRAMQQQKAAQEKAAADEAYREKTIALQEQGLNQRGEHFNKKLNQDSNHFNASNELNHSKLEQQQKAAQIKAQVKPLQDKIQDIRRQMLKVQGGDSILGQEQAAALVQQYADNITALELQIKQISGTQLLDPLNLRGRSNPQNANPHAR